MTQQTTPPATGPGTRALSRHTNANAYRYGAEASNLNAWCRIPGSPFSDGLVLLPNPPTANEPSVSYAPIDTRTADAVTLLFVSAARPEHDNRLAVTARVLAADGAVLAETRIVLAAGERAPATLRFVPPDGPIGLRVAVGFDEFAGGRAFGSVRLRYAAAYRDNELTRLFNEAGSDKGSERYWGEGVPHHYALVYEPLLAPFREERFNLLEIGLDTASQESGRPTDAPSLRVWREFVPNATLYGYDINDFAFFDQPNTHVFRGDQSSRGDFGRFLESHGMPLFRVVIDDGSHVPAHQQISLAALFERLEPGGVYVVEDLTWQPYEQSPTTLEVLREFVEHGRVESPFIADADARRLETSIASVEIVKPNDSEMALIRKAHQ